MTTFRVYAGFGSFPTVALSAVSWTDITAYVRSFRVSHGRQNELGTFEAGTGFVELNNADRRFDPSYAAGPYYGNLRPMCRIRIDVGVSVLYVGYVEHWPLNWMPGSSWSFSTVGMADALKALNVGIIWSGRPSELAGARIGGVLTAGSWPAGDRVLATGTLTLNALAAPDPITGVNTLSTIKSAAVSDSGRFYADRQGRVVFEDNTTRATQTRSSVVQATFGDNPGEIAYSSLSGRFDDYDIANYVTFSNNGTTDLVQDAASETTYLVRPTSLSFGLVSDANAEALANIHLERYKQPVLRFDALTAKRDFDHADVATLAALEVSDLVDIYRRPTLGAGINILSYVESIEHSLDAGGLFQTKLTTSPANLTGYFILDSAIFGVLDQNRLGI